VGPGVRTLLSRSSPCSQGCRGNRVTISALKENHFQATHSYEDEVPTFGWRGWNPLSQRLAEKLFVEASSRLIQAYVERHGRPSLIHAHSVRWAGVAAAKVANRLQLPLVITEHSSAVAEGQIPSWAKDHVSAAFRRADSVIAVSNFLSGRLEEWLGDVHIHVIPNIVDTNFFYRPPTERAHTPSVVLTVGHLQEEKTVDVLIRAFVHAFGGDPSVILAIGGVGDQLPALRRLAKSLDLDRQIRFLGVLHREEVRKAMWRADVYACSSSIETFGVALVEAMATGLPVLSTRSGGPSEVVIGGTGWLVPPNDVVSFAQGLRLALSHARKGVDERLIRDHAVSTYGADVVVPALLSEYERVLT
jgi:glycosyltransferase involved in cell wall biosynthesis